MNEILKEFKVVLGLDTKGFFKNLWSAESEVRKVGERIRDTLGAYFSFDFMKDQFLKFINDAKEIGETVDILGVDSKFFQSLSNSVELYDGDLKSVKSTLTSLNQAANDLKYGQGSLIEASSKYGISLRALNKEGINSKEFLTDLADKMQTLNAAQRADLASMLGIDESMLKLLSQGSAKFQEVIKSQEQFGFYTKQDQALSTQFKESLLVLSKSLESIGRTFMRIVVPPIAKFFKLLADGFSFVSKNKALMIGFFTLLTMATGALTGATIKLGIATMAAYAPYAAVAAVVAGLALVFEDLYHYFEGNNSLAGELAKKYKAVGVVLEWLRPVYEKLKESISALAEWFKDPTWENFANAMKKIGSSILDGLLAPLRFVFSTIASLFEKLSEWGLMSDEWAKKTQSLANNINTEGISKAINSTVSIVNNITNHQNVAKLNGDQIAEALNSVNAQAERFRK